MIKKLLCLTLFFTITVTPLMGTQFALQEKPSKPEPLSRPVYAAVKIVSIGAIVTTYMALDKKPTNNLIELLMRSTKICLSVLSLGAATKIIGDHVYFNSKAYLWDNRTNQEVYDDALATYENNLEQIDRLHVVAQQLTILPRIKLKEVQNILTQLYFEANYDPLAILVSRYRPLKHHYKALVERVEQHVGFLDSSQWDTLRKNMEKELEQFSTSIAFFDKIKKDQTNNWEQ